MYFDNKPCAVCGAEIRLRARRTPSEAETRQPAGPSDGVVGAGDETVDERVCTNPECPSHSTEQDA